MINNEALIIPAPVRYVIDRLEKAGFHAYCVGGCVRDHLMGRVPYDYDVTTSALPSEMQKIFAGDRVVETGLKHGTLTIVRDGMNIETTTYRIDGTYDDGRHPDSVTFTDNLADDLCRRDFTVNAMAYSPERGVVDLFGGRRDLENRVIRCVGEAEERFSEDGLRILRALRFASVLDFEPDEACERAVRAKLNLLSRISRERIFSELTKLLGGPAAGRVLRRYPDVIAFILPSLTAEAVVQTADSVDAGRTAAPDDEPMRYALLFRTLTDEEAAGMLASLKPSKNFTRQTRSLLASRTEMIPSCESDLLRLMNRYGDDFPARMAVYAVLCGRISGEEAREIGKEAERLLAEGRCCHLKDLDLTGTELSAAGMTGASIGLALEKALGAVMDGNVPNERKALLAWLADGKDTVS